MKRLISFTLVAVTTIAASASAEMWRSHLSIRGGSLSASWSWSDDCSVTFLELWAADETRLLDGGQHDAVQYAGVYGSRSDWCTSDSFELSNLGAIGTLAIDDLDAATLEVPVSRVAWTCDDTGACTAEAVETATLTLSLTGIGDTSTEQWSSSWSGAGTRARERGNGRTRAADAVGSLVLGGVELLAGETDAELRDVKTGSLTLVRQ